MARSDESLDDAESEVRAGMLVYAHRANVTSGAFRPVAELWIGGASHSAEGSFVAFWPPLLTTADIPKPDVLREAAVLRARFVAESNGVAVVLRHAAVCCLKATGPARDAAVDAESATRESPAVRCPQGQV